MMSLGGLGFRVLTNVGVYDEFGRFRVLGFRTTLGYIYDEFGRFRVLKNVGGI
jgi:hypothetical protein